MTTQNIGLLKAMAAKMSYLDQRQRVIAQNVANADTPDYKPKDLLPVDFGEVLQSVRKDNQVRVERTNAQHMSMSGDVDDPKRRDQKQTYEVAPAGNAVSLEEQMIKSSENTMDYNTMVRLYQKHLGMMRTALGVGR